MPQLHKGAALRVTLLACAAAHGVFALLQASVDSGQALARIARVPPTRQPSSSRQYAWPAAKKLAAACTYSTTIANTHHPLACAVKPTCARSSTRPAAPAFTRERAQRARCRVSESRARHGPAY